MRIPIGSWGPCAAGVALVVLLGTSAAQALNTRTWVASTGADGAGCGPITSPCRTLQWAHDATASGGEIDVKDSAGYGSLVITKAINIIADGSLAGVLAPAGGDAIRIDAGAFDTVVLRGLTIDGARQARYGIVFNSGGKLEIADCVVQNFATVAANPIGTGILLKPSAGKPTIIIAGTTASHNFYEGVSYKAPSGGTAAASIIIDRVTASQNGAEGVLIDTFGSAAPVTASLTNSFASNNGSDGFLVYGGGANAPITAVIDLCGADINNVGYSIQDNATVTIGRSRAANNRAYGILTFGTVLSFGNNQLGGNGVTTNAVLGVATLN